MIPNWNYVAFLLGWAANSIRLAVERNTAYRVTGWTWGAAARRAMLRERRQVAGRMWWCLLRAACYVNAGRATA